MTSRRILLAVFWTAASVVVASGVVTLLGAQQTADQIKGILTWSGSNQPIVGAIVSIGSDRRGPNTLTSSEGHFVLEKTDQNFVTVSLIRQRDDGSLLVDYFRDFSLASHSGSSMLKLELPRLRTEVSLRGKLRANSPANALVEAVRTSPFRVGQTTFTDGDGNFELRGLPSGTYEVIVITQSGAKARERIDVPSKNVIMFSASEPK